MLIGFRNLTIHYFWFVLLIPWFRILFLSRKPLVQDQENRDDEYDDHHDFDYDVEAQLSMSPNSSAEVLDSDRGSISDFSSNFHSDSGFTSSSSLSLTQCRFRDSYHSSNSSDGSPSSIDQIAPCFNESINCEEERRALESPSSTSKPRKSRRSTNLNRTDQTNRTEPDFLHPITKVLRKQELAKQILGLAIPMTMGLMAYYNPMAMKLATRLAFILLCVGFAALWNGNLLHETYPGFSNKIELLGYACMLSAFYSLVAYFLRFTYLALVPVICLFLSFVPLGMAFYNRNCAFR